MDDTWEENLTAKFQTRILSLKIFGVKGHQGGDGTKSKKNPQRIGFCNDNGRGFVDGCDVELINDDEEDA